MRNIWLVLKHEIAATMGKRSYWIMTFLFPTFIIAMNVGMQVMITREFSSEASFIPGQTGEAEASVTGYIDQSGLVRDVPTSIPSGMLQSFSSETQAQAALNAGEIDHYILIPASYIETGELILVAREFKPFQDGQEDLLQYVINYNLTGDEELAGILLNPTAGVSQHPLAPQAGPEKGSAAAFIVPYATLFIFFMLLTMSSGFMLRSVAREKENRTAEVLLLSLSPRELMLGKIAGLSFVALFQMAVWGGGGLVVLNRGRQLWDALANFHFPSSFLLIAALYFFLGYLMFSSMMGAIGALAPNAQEVGQFSLIVMLPLMVPLMLSNSLINSPNGLLATVLSLFPLTAPTTMMTRLVASPVPAWQVAASLTGLAVTTYGLILAAARFFRADTLLSYTKLNWGQIARMYRAAKRTA